MTPQPDHIRGINNAFAAFTITTRFPAILDKILADNQYPASIKERVLSLRTEIPGGTIRPIDDAGEDLNAWRDWMAPFMGQNWLEAPFLEVEIYFYRRILEALHYFGTEDPNDPFLPQKLENLQDYEASIIALCKLRETMETATLHTDLPALLLGNLWGNRADLSLLPEARMALGTDLLAAGTQSLVTNDLAPIVDFFTRQPSPFPRVDFINDNSGVELVGDLILAEYFLTHQLAETVHFQVKTRPFYVSDAMDSDVRMTIQWMVNHAHPLIHGPGKRLAELLDQRLLLTAHEFWISPFCYRQLPPDITDDLAHSSLLIFKGDLNYRRLIEDRFWNYTTPINSLVDYLPVPAIALRTLKSDVLAGIPVEGPYPFERPDWLISGKMGLVQWIGA